MRTMDEKENSASAPVMVSSNETPAELAAPPPLGHFRWVICALLFFATTINYVDRAVL
jgi:hypothetical protein